MKGMEGRCREVSTSALSRSLLCPRAGRGAWGPRAGVNAAISLRSSLLLFLSSLLRPHPPLCLSGFMGQPRGHLSVVVEEAGGVDWGGGYLPSILPWPGCPSPGWAQVRGAARTGTVAQSWSHQTSCPQSSLAVVPATFFLFVWTSVGLGYKFVAGRGGVDGANSHLLVGSGWPLSPGRASLRPRKGKDKAMSFVIYQMGSLGYHSSLLEPVS